jgi:hypothetical protein
VAGLKGDQLPGVIGFCGGELTCARWGAKAEAESFPRIPIAGVTVHRTCDRCDDVSSCSSSIQLLLNSYILTINCKVSFSKVI